MENGTTLAGILSSTTEMFTSVMSMAGDVGEVVTTTPILLMFTLVPIVGLGIGLWNRLIGR